MADIIICELSDQAIPGGLEKFDVIYYSKLVDGTEQFVEVFPKSIEKVLAR